MTPRVGKDCLFLMKRIGRNDPCWCGSGKKYKKCHMDFDQRIHQFALDGAEVPPHSLLKTPAQIEKIKESAKINIAVLDYVAAHIGAGVTTEEIDRWVYEQTVLRGGVPAPLHYEGYPKSVCTSIDDVICHGIPSPDRVLKEGEIVNVDCSTVLNGFYSDSSRMFCIGEISPEKQRLVKVARESLDVGLKEVRPWRFLGDMADAINRFVTQNGFSVVRDIGGHGIGLAFHEDPWVSYVAKPGTEMLMVPGMVFTIEPMINMGSCEIREDKEDGWTIYTADGLPSAQWEIQVAVTEDGCEVLSY